MGYRKEIWGYVPNSNELYEVSTFGNIRSVRSGKLLKSQKTSKGYLRVSLLGRKERIHRLVAKNFLANPLNKPEVHHKNSDKEDNRLSNLEWVTGEENRSYNDLGEKALFKVCLCGNCVKEYKSISEASRDSGLSVENISSSANGRSKLSGGYLWKFK